MMLRRITQITVQNLKLSQAVRTSSHAASSKEKWDLYAGVLVERLPVVSKSLSPLEQQLQEVLWRVEFENSLKSDHEMQHERDLRQAELIKKGKLELDVDEASSKQTAQDKKDAYVEEIKKFNLASRKTQDDVKNNINSTNRCLDNSLYLLVEQSIGKKQYFLLPQGQRDEGETMRQTAERVVREKCGDQLQVFFYSNAPCGFYKYKYPIDSRNDSVGAKIFFYRATLKQGNINQPKVGFAWLTKEDLSNKLTNAAYAESVQKFLL